MSRQRTLIAVMLLLTTLAAIQYLRTPARPTIFTKQSFAQAQAEAGSGKLLVVDFSALWCGPCQDMDRSTWTNPQLVEWLKANAIAVKVDIDEDKARARTFGIAAIPVVVVLKGKTEVARINGSVSADELLQRLKAAASQ